MEKRITIRLSGEDYRSLERQAKKEGLTISQVLRKAWIQENEQDCVLQKLDELENRITERMNQRFDHVVKILGIIGKKVEWIVDRLSNIKKKPSGASGGN